MKNFGLLFFCCIPGSLHANFHNSSFSDREILLAAGLKPRDLPDHLSLLDNDNFAEPVPDACGQPDDRDSQTDMQQFYQADSPNGHKPLQLMQIVALQVRTNPNCDQHADIFGVAVWKTLDNATKTKLQNSAKANPPEKASIADTLYTPIRTILQQSPYDVPSPLLDSFTSMKAPEVTEWMIRSQT